MECLLKVVALQTAQLGPLDLCVQASEMVQLVGPSGAGKSLLLRAIADLDPNTGQLWVDGQERSTLTPTQWRCRVAYVPAETAWWDLRVRDHLPASSVAQATAWLERMALTVEALDWEIERLSSGERQRLGLLRALLNQPRVLLLDEPTANLDLDNTRRIERMVRDYLSETGAAALWVSHDTLQRARLGGRVLTMRSGQWLAE